MMKILNSNKNVKSGKSNAVRLITRTALIFFLLSSEVANSAENGIENFEITRFAVVGNTLLSTQTIDSILMPFTGKERDFGHVQRALEALEGAYHQLGYSVVQVALPEQELNQGVVRFQVVETRIGKVKVEGNQVFNEANIRHSLPGLREGETPNIEKVSTSLRMANENPSKKTSLHLQSDDKEGEIDAVLKITDEKAWRLSTSLDNTGNKSTGNSRFTVLYQHANVANLDHVLSVQYTTALENPSKVSIYGAGYHIPLYALGDSIDLFANYSDVDSGSVAAGLFNLQVSGQGTTVGSRYNQNLKRLGNLESKLIYGLDYKAYENNLQLQGVPLGNDITVHPLSVSYAGSWPLATGETAFSLTAMRNIPGGDRGGEADFNRVRSGASSTYRLLRYAINYSSALANNWQVRLGFSGQYTPDSLVPGEQFGAGGASSVRGFTERELSDDKGHMATAELYTPNLCVGVQKVATQCRLLAFYDAARVSRNDPLPGEQAHASISSVGLGWRLVMDKYLTLQMDYGRVVDAGGTKNKGSDRVHFRLGLAY
ncbi:MAG: ShlB/FhaC/HecB family hemolysin secretion/activation protein [Pseudomonadota bacterium]